MTFKSKPRDTCPPTRVAIIKKIIASVGRDVGKLESSYTTSGNRKQCNHFLKNSLSVPHSVQHSVTMCCRCFTPEYLSKRSENIMSSQNLYMFTAVLFIIASKWKTHVSSSWWMAKQNVVYLYNKIFLGNKNYAITWINFEHIMLCERSQIPRPHIVILHLYEKSRI